VVGVLGSLRGELTKTEQLLDPQQETGTADPTDQNSDLHTARQYCPPTMRYPGRGEPPGDRAGAGRYRPRSGHRNEGRNAEPNEGTQ
jgi:hypothetical protein